MKNIVIIIIQLLICVSAIGQATISGQFTHHAGAPIYLTGFKGLTSYIIDSTIVSESGEFSLQYPDEYIGMGILHIGPQQSHVLVLEPGGVHLTGTMLAVKDSLHIIKGQENQWFIQYAREHQLRERVLSGWVQMKNIYTQDTMFSRQNTLIRHIKQEIDRIRIEDSLYIDNLPDDSYIKWYLPFRSLVSSVQAVAKYRTDEVPSVVQEFRKINYSEPRWYTSGLMKDAIEAHVWLIENSAGSLDSVFAALNTSTDLLIDKLKDQPEMLNPITEHLFKFLEQRSLFTAAEHLALKMLNDDSCILEQDLNKMMESYRAMKKGNRAPNISFSGDVFAPGYTNENKPTQLSEVNCSYKVVIFGASWCPQCPKELQEIIKNYAGWKPQGVEVIFISLDEDDQIFASFTQPFPFISICDYQKWESKAVKDYHIFATPTIYLLNDKHEIILKPHSANQLNAWIDWFLVKGNK